MFPPVPASFSGARVTVFGLGLFGGGEGAARFLAEEGADVWVVDEAPAERFAAVRARLAPLPLRFSFGPPPEEAFARADWVVVNPAVRPASPWRALLDRRGVPWTTETNIFLSRCPIPVVGITGTNGKSTTTALAGALLGAAGLPVWVGGNLGRSLLGDLAAMRRVGTGAAVLELSSFQLADLPQLGVSPRVAVVTNLSENHLDHHGDFTAYAVAKRNILAFQGPADAAVLPADDPVLSGWRVAGRRITFARGAAADVRVDADAIHPFAGPAISVRGARLPGAHNRLNMAAAVAAALACLDRRDPPAGWDGVLTAFRGLPHRIAFVREAGGVRFYDDSKATTPEAALAALDAFDGPVVLIAGGRSKGGDLAAFGRGLARRAHLKRVVATGEAGAAIAAALSAAGFTAIEETPAFDDACRRAAAAASPGDVVLLSPGCASFDRFVNYAARGDRFRAIVEGLRIENPSIRRAAPFIMPGMKPQVRPSAVFETNLLDLGPVRRGKVRDLYDLGDVLLLVATDRVSAFDWVIPTPIPGKGRLLTGLSCFWFDVFRDVPNHLVTADIARMPPNVRAHEATLSGRTMLARKLEILPVECVVRGYLVGSGWDAYRKTGAVCGIPLPAGLARGQKLPEPIFTPTTKENQGHDQPITYADMERTVGTAWARRLKEASLSLYMRAHDLAARKGILIADTKFEWGRSGEDLILADEVLTPDSSRFWPAEDHHPGAEQPSFDKQFIRDFLSTTAWDKQSPPPALPPEIVEKTVARYREAYRRLVGRDPA